VAGQLWPGIRIHTVDIAHPPGIDISPIADIDAHQTIVPAAQAMKTNAETPKKGMRRKVSAILGAPSPGSSRRSSVIVLSFER
jgi:hypothetical protein